MDYLNVWRVTFDSVFRSSSGMQAYESRSTNKTSLVLTKSDSLELVRKTLEDSQTEVTLKHVEWLGMAEQPPRPE